MADWMIDQNDPACADIAGRAQQLGIAGTPDKAVHALGEVVLADGRVVNAYVLHAVDPIITDGDSVVLINRKYPPHQGMPALPGGMIDPLKGGGIESAVQAAAREAMEEVNADLAGVPHTLIGTRNMYRPHDVRIAINDGLESNFGIKKGDVFMVSTQAVRFDVSDLSALAIQAGSDAKPGSARPVKLASLTREFFGSGDHYDMIVQALPEKFSGGGAVSGARARPQTLSA